MKQFNILYIHSHNTGRYIQPYGYAVPTPNMQRLAEEGILFRQAYSACPTCSPSRACIVTGRSAHSNGMLGLSHRGFSLYDNQHHIVHTLRQAGYDSTLIGVQHITGEPDKIGYDRLMFADTPGSAPTEETTSAAVDFLSNPPGKPFFLNVGFVETHIPFPKPDPDIVAGYCLPPAPLPDHPIVRKEMAGFKTSARILDRNIGIVLDALKANGLAENTLVICTTDHGVQMPRMITNATEHGLGVFLIMRGPAGFVGGKISDALVSQIDLFPTLCDLLEIDPPKWLEGKSLMPVIRGQAEEVNEEIFGENNYHASYEPQRTVVTHRWRYCRRIGDRRKVVLPNVDDSPIKDLLIEKGWTEQIIPTEQLYDRIFDRHEAHNLAGDPAYAEPLTEMRKRLDNWMQQTNDPFLNGQIPAPSGARLQHPDGVSPTDDTVFYVS